MYARLQTLVMFVTLAISMMIRRSVHNAMTLRVRFARVAPKRINALSVVLATHSA